MTACHCSGFIRMMSVSRVMPALLTSTSTVPQESTASLNSLHAEAGMLMFCESLNMMVVGLRRVGIVRLQATQLLWEGMTGVGHNAWWASCHKDGPC